MSFPLPYSEGSFPYSVLLASYRLPEMAERGESLFRREGLEPYRVQVDLDPKGVWHRLFTGFFASREGAERYRSDHRLEEARVKRTRFSTLLESTLDPEDAERKAASLAGRGLSPYVVVDHRGVHHVLVGAFFTLVGAEDQKALLEKMGIESRVIER
jgi:hypothetical protein